MYAVPQILGLVPDRPPYTNAAGNGAVLLIAIYGMSPSAFSESVGVFSHWDTVR